MKIVDIATTVVGTPWRELTFVELTTDTGLVGTSEVRMVQKTDTLLACIGELGDRYLIDADPYDSERLAWNLTVGDYGRPGEVTMSTLAAFEMACLDIVGLDLGVPLWKLLGGRFRERVPAYANGWYQSEPDPARIAALATGVAARGYRCLKIDPFGHAAAEIDPDAADRAAAILSACREAVGPEMGIAVEMHGRFTAAAAVDMAQRIAHLRPEWIEEPVAPEALTALARVRQCTSIPIATGERIHQMHEFRDILERGLADYIQADPTHFGGLVPLRKLAAWAGVHSLLMAPHNVCGPVGTAANVHLGVAISNYKVLEHFNDFADSWVLGLVDSPPRVEEDGCFALPTAPGLGMRLNHEACAAHPRSRARLQLFEEGWELRQAARP